MLQPRLPLLPSAARQAFALALVASLACTQRVTRPPEAASAAGPRDPLDERVPLDLRVKKGKLENGLTWYVLPHHKPEKRASLWLAVNTGSVLEDDDQRGLAHFVEHMGFSGTRRFPKQALVDMLEKSGVAFGADLNAHTSFDETVYKLTVPTDKPELVGQALSVLRDWAGDITFDLGAMERERNVILEEWRLGRGADARLFDKQAPVVFHGSKYAERLPIGLPDTIRGAPREALLRFYKDWYRPDLMAVVAVGDFDPAVLEAGIRQEFASLPAAQGPRPRPAVPVPAHGETLFSIETDPEATGTHLSVLTKRPHQDGARVRDQRRLFVEQLFAAMFNARLDELRRRAAPPFLAAGAGASALVRTADAFSLGAVVKEGGVEEGYAALLEELLRVERHGFTATELERTRLNLLRLMERNAKERETSDARDLAAEAVRNFLTDEPMPGAEAELQLATRLLPGITVEEVNRMAASLSAGSRVVSVSGPATMTRPTEASLQALTRTVAARTIAPYDDGASNVPLLAQPPVPGKVVATRSIPELDVTEWTLSNGVRVVLKPTDFKKDEISINGFAPGGTSLASDADFPSVRFGDALARESGLGPFDVVGLRKALAGKVVASGAQIGELDTYVYGSAAPADLETLFQLVHLRFTGARRDDAAISAWRALERERARTRRLSPEGTFAEEMVLFASQGHPRRQPVTPEVVDQIDVAKALQFYRDRFADASGFTFLLVGQLDLTRTRQLAELYLGSLPAGQRKEGWRDIGVHLREGVARKEVAAGSEPKARVSLTFHGEAAWSRDADNDLTNLALVLRIRLRELLREDLGGVYGVTVSGGISRRPRQEFTFQIGFGCAPANVEKLEQALFAEIKSIQEKGIGADYLAKVKEQRRRAHEVQLKENGYWTGELFTAWLYGDDPRQMLDFDAQVEKATAERVQAAAIKYLDQRQYLLGELRPASAQAGR